ncbi:hypothetical protein [Jannaschia formosa]|uniref:hypothetical protein n=1 Tax=Jannaschia formosa TaxID=2259592 RepID=UPI000E1BB640|nr:hypothetical protein [Jannaschia formosa]TFL16114.1 hypothetical protein DR046_21785 [Jannaschia formosa]
MTDHASSSARQDPPAVEIGWMIDRDLPPDRREAARSAAEAMRTALAEGMPQFRWVVDTQAAPPLGDTGQIEPVQLLDRAETLRDAKGWDFVLVVTARELRGRERAEVLGVTSGIFATALVSTAHLGASEGAGLRLQALAMHLFGRLNGLAPDESGTWMRRIDGPDDLDGMQGYAPDALQDLTERMETVADLRVEEMGAARQGPVAFYARSLWHNRAALPRTILRMRPWSFPLHLRRLTTAAGSALAVLVMTAESWEVAANLSLPTIAVLSLAAIAATSAYLIRVQRLVAGRQGPLREQRAVSNAGTVVAVGIGMAVTWAAVFAVAWLLATALFGDALLEGWTGMSGAALRVRLAALAAALSVVIGALGASFEPYGYFRHVTQVDDEI